MTQNLLEALDNTIKALLPEVVKIPTAQTTSAEDDKIAGEDDTIVVKKTQKRSSGGLHS